MKALGLEGGDKEKGILVLILFVVLALFEEGGVGKSHWVTRPERRERVGEEGLGVSSVVDGGSCGGGAVVVVLVVVRVVVSGGVSFSSVLGVRGNGLSCRVTGSGAET